MTDPEVGMGLDAVVDRANSRTGRMPKRTLTSHALCSLEIRNYRLFASGQLVSLTGTWMQRVGQDWLVLQLSHNNGAALGLTTSLQFLPYAFVSVPSGLLGDHYSKRRLLLGTQTMMGGLALALGSLDAAGLIRLWQVYLIAALLGITAAVDSPVRQAFVSELVPQDMLTNAVSLNSASFNFGRVLGPICAGLLIERIGTPTVFLLNSASFVAVIVGLMLMNESEICSPAGKIKSSSRPTQGFRYVAGHPDMLAAVLLVSVVATIGMNNLPIIMGLMARETYHAGAGGFGLLSTAFALGAFAGTMISARLTRPRRSLLFKSAWAFCAIDTVAAIAPTYWLFALALSLLGSATYLVITSANATLQLGAPTELRGRVMAVYLVAFFGPTPLGALALGYGANALGPRAVLAVAGLFSVLVVAVTALVLVRRGSPSALVPTE